MAGRLCLPDSSGVVDVCFGRNYFIDHRNGYFKLSSDKSCNSKPCEELENGIKGLQQSCIYPLQTIFCKQLMSVKKPGHQMLECKLQPLYLLNQYVPITSSMS